MLALAEAGNGPGHREQCPVLSCLDEVAGWLDSSQLTAWPHHVKQRNGLVSPCYPV